MRARLSLGALGLALVLLVGAAWGTGIPYLLARLGPGSPVRLASMDGIHVYVGLVGGVFLLAKVSRAGFHHRVVGVANVVPWQRWLSWSTLALYGVVFTTGTLALLPIRGRLYGDLVEMHFLASVWALPPTTWHAWHYRARALPFVRPWRGRATVRRYWAGLGLVVLPVPVLLSNPAAITQLPEVMGGPAWSPAGLGDSYLDEVTTTPGGGTLLAAGDALYVSHDGVVWVRIDVPQVGGPAPAAPAAESPMGHQHGQPAPPNPITALAVTPDAVFVGTARNLYSSAGLDGPLAPVAFPGRGVRALAADPGDTRSMWVASTTGPLFTADGGLTWARLATGLTRPGRVSAIAYLGRDAFVSDTTGVFRWSAGSRSWRRTSGEPSVMALTAGPGGGQLYASSRDDVQVYGASGWIDLDAPAPEHNHGGHARSGPLGGVTVVSGRLYVAGSPDGVSASAGGGGAWTQLGGGLSSVTPYQLTDFGGSLWAATSGGLYRFPLVPSRAASALWWLALVAFAGGLGVTAAAVGAAGPGPGPRRPSGRR